MKNELVPFGKHKGKPVTDLLADPEYCDWILLQDGMEKRYPDLIREIKSLRLPDVTPEHNALQAEFLDRRRALGLLCLVKPEVRAELEYFSSLHERLPAFRAKGWAVEFKNEFQHELEYLKDERQPDSKRVIRYCHDLFVKIELKFSEDFYSSPRLKESGISISSPECRMLREEYDRDFRELAQRDKEHVWEVNGLRAEIKPYVSDDYPAVLRQMFFNNSTTLFLDQFSSRAVNIEQLRKIFQLKNLKLATKEELDKFMETFP